MCIMHIRNNVIEYDQWPRYTGNGHVQEAAQPLCVLMWMATWPYVPSNMALVCPDACGVQYDPCVS